MYNNYICNNRNVKNKNSVSEHTYKYAIFLGTHSDINIFLHLIKSENKI